MAAIIALTKTLGDDAVKIIDSFDGSTSVVTIFGTEADDIANVDDLTHFSVLVHTQMFNKCLSHWLYHGSLEYPLRS